VNLSTDIQEISEDFICEPIQAIHCKLANIVTQEWNEYWINEFTNVVDGKSLIVSKLLYNYG